MYLIVAAFVPIAPEVNTWFPLSTKAYASSSIICGHTRGPHKTYMGVGGEVKKKNVFVEYRQSKKTNTAVYACSSAEEHRHGAQ